MNRQKQKNAGKGGLLIGAVVVIAVLLIIIIYLLSSRNAEPEEERRNVVITPENVEEILEEIDKAQESESVVPGYYTVTMNPTWHFASGNEASYDAVVVNVETNTHDVYFDIVLEENEEIVLYKSPVIPRGGRLENIALDEPLDAGTYNCVVIYHLIDGDQKTLSTLRVTLNIIIEN